MNVTPEIALEDLQKYFKMNDITISLHVLEIFREFEYRCYKYNAFPFYWEMLAPLIKVEPLCNIISKYGSEPVKVFEQLEKVTMEEAKDNDPYVIGTLYSREEGSCRRKIVDYCIRRIKSESRKELTPKDIVLSLLDTHNEVNPTYDNGNYNDSRFHTSYNTLSHIVCKYIKPLWIKFEDIKRELDSLYDLAISFAGEDREIARVIAHKITSLGHKVFFDEYEKSTLWGKDLYCHLTEVYSLKTRFCLMIVSEHYKNKVWTNLERQASQARAMKEHTEYILPLRIDDTNIPGLLPTIGYIDLRSTSLSEIVDLIRIKLSDVNANPHIV